MPEDPYAYAKSRRLSANRMLVDLIENGIEAEKRKQQEFFELAGRFRNTTAWRAYRGYYTLRVCRSKSLCELPRDR